MPKANILDGRLALLSDENGRVRVRFTDKNHQMVDALVAQGHSALASLQMGKRYIVSVEQIDDSPAGGTP